MPVSTFIVASEDIAIVTLGFRAQNCFCGGGGVREVRVAVLRRVNFPEFG